MQSSSDIERDSRELVWASVVNAALIKVKRMPGSLITGAKSGRFDSFRQTKRGHTDSPIPGASRRRPVQTIFRRPPFTAALEGTRLTRVQRLVEKFAR